MVHWNLSSHQVAWRSLACVSCTSTQSSPVGLWWDPIWNTTGRDSQICLTWLQLFVYNCFFRSFASGPPGAWKCGACCGKEGNCEGLKPHMTQQCNSSGCWELSHPTFAEALEVSFGLTKSWQDLFNSLWTWFFIPKIGYRIPPNPLTYIIMEESLGEDLIKTHAKPPTWSQPRGQRRWLSPNKHLLHWTCKSRRVHLFQRATSNW